MLCDHTLLNHVFVPSHVRIDLQMKVQRHGLGVYGYPAIHLSGSILFNDFLCGHFIQYPTHHCKEHRTQEEITALR